MTEATVIRIEGSAPAREIDDCVAVEEPLEIQIASPSGEYRSVSVTMRTPGNDRELVAGFLYNENIIDSAADISSITHYGALHGDEKVHNVVRVEFARPVAGLRRLDRHFYTSSACGACGKADLSALRVRPSTLGPGITLTAAAVRQLPHALAESQIAFAHTGGLHATAVFDPRAKLRYAFEDIGRHNALDKAAGALLFDDALPAENATVFVSGRVGFELVQKTVRMGATVLCAIGAPSSLAIELARAAGLTLVGFIRNDHFNVYTSPERIES